MRVERENEATAAESRARDKKMNWVKQAETQERGRTKLTQTGTHHPDLKHKQGKMGIKPTNESQTFTS
jgi:hypothetical protein